MFLSALLVQEKSPLVVAEAVVLDVHRDDSADSPEGVEHGRDQCTIPVSCRP